MHEHSGGEMNSDLATWITFCRANAFRFCGVMELSSNVQYNGV